MKQATRLKGMATALSMAALVSGCSSMGLGESEYSCDGIPDGVSCTSATEQYRMTTGSGSNLSGGGGSASGSQSEDKHPAGEGRDKHTRTREEGPGKRPMSGPAQMPSMSRERENRVIHEIRHKDEYVAPSTPKDPQPVRTPAEVMRVWVGPWEDKQGSLHVSSYVYSEIEQRKWLYDNPAQSQGGTRRLQPLQQMQDDIEFGGGAPPQQPGDQQPGESRQGGASALQQR